MVVRATKVSPRALRSESQGFPVVCARERAARRGRDRGCFSLLLQRLAAQWPRRLQAGMQRGWAVGLSALPFCLFFCFFASLSADFDARQDRNARRFWPSGFAVKAQWRWLVSMVDQIVGSGAGLRKTCNFEECAVLSGLVKIRWTSVLGREYRRVGCSIDVGETW